LAPTVFSTVSNTFLGILRGSLSVDSIVMSPVELVMLVVPDTNVSITLDPVPVIRSSGVPSGNCISIDVASSGPFARDA